jgi:predicted transcriptional regulator
MFSPAIKQMLEEKSSTFIIPASQIAFVEDENPLYHAFLILTRVKYSKIPVLDRQSRVVGLLSLSMITTKMMETNKISLDPLNNLKVHDVMQTKFDKVNYSQITLETQLHLLVDNAFLPVIDDYGIFKGLLTRREWIKAFNYIAHNLNKKYKLSQIK